MKFSKEEMVDMTFILGECDRNSLLASRVYAQRFPDERQSDARCFEKLLIKFIETGNINQLSVLLTVTEDPNKSQREISQVTYISQTFVQRILKVNKFHAFHVRLHQKPNYQDYENRINFFQLGN
ncbi:hypothetical protein HHI36_024199 [Cryptolaemus montrouzieri]|uniref:DUF4817 domain-containing protein n=1 Tax=Cryptolaemus montrouzieri TaxID=559131 RepID=A0ABD2NC98_9CUCU